MKILKNPPLPRVVAESKRWFRIRTSPAPASVLAIVFGLQLSVMTNCAIAGWFTSDGKSYEECMENRRGDIRNSSQYAIASDYCYAKHPPPPPAQANPVEQVFDYVVIWIGSSESTLAELINKLTYNRINVVQDEFQQYPPYVTVDIFNRNDFPVVGVSIGMLKPKIKACSWDENSYADIYRCTGAALQHASGSFSCPIPNAERGVGRSCVVGFTVRGTPSNVRDLMNRNNISSQQIAAVPSTNSP